MNNYQYYAMLCRGSYNAMLLPTYNIDYLYNIICCKIYMHIYLLDGPIDKHELLESITF